MYFNTMNIVGYSTQLLRYPNITTGYSCKMNYPISYIILYEKSITFEII